MTGVRNNKEDIMRILVVEDEVKVANALREGLEFERYEVAVESTGEGWFFRMTTETFDLMLLDITLPAATACRFFRRFATGACGRRSWC